MADAGTASAAEHMDAIYGWQAGIYDVTRKYYLLGRDQLITGLKAPPRGAILEVGCGTGRNLIRAARLYPEARLFGFDISRVMLATAERTIARAGLTGRIRLAQADAAAFDPAAAFGRTGFDRVFCSYTLSMIPPWEEALRRAAACVAPGGSLHVVDFGSQEHLPAWFKSGLRAWLRRFAVEPRDQLEARLAALAGETGLDLSFTRPWRGYAAYGVARRRPLA
jgi:S-adenosylmethionine-diacylgycerolhomoserine-N-methlytransferase